MRKLTLSIVLVLFCTLSASAQQLQTVQFVSGLYNPVAFVQDPSQPDVQFVVEQAGRIRTIVNGTLQDASFLDLSDGVASAGENQGMLGLAFPPDYGSTGRFFVFFTDPNGNAVLSRFVRADALHAS